MRPCVEDGAPGPFPRPFQAWARVVSRGRRSRGEVLGWVRGSSGCNESFMECVRRLGFGGYDFSDGGNDTGGKRVLIVRTSAMGDVLHALPAVAALRRQHPEWFIGWVIDPRWMPLLESAGCCAEPGVRPERPIVDRVHQVPTQAWKRKAFSMETVRGIGRLRRELRAERYDLCIDMQGLIRSSLVGAVSGSARFVGRNKPRETPARWFYGERVETPAAHVIEQGCELVSGAVGETAAAGRGDAAGRQGCGGLGG